MVNHKKQFVRKLTLPSAEDRIRSAVELKKDERLLSVIRGISSLLSAEFKCHEKCQSDYVRCVPATKKRKITDDIAENVEGSVIGSKTLRKRQNNSHGSLDDGVDEAETGMDFPEVVSESVPEPVPESALESVVESVPDSVPEPVPESVPESVVESIPDSVDMCQSSLAVFDNSGQKIDAPEKGGKERLHLYILEKIIRDNNCVSMKILTDVYGYDGNDKRMRFKVKKMIEDDFRDQVIFIASVNEPQVVARRAMRCSIATSMIRYLREL